MGLVMEAEGRDCFLLEGGEWRQKLVRGQSHVHPRCGFRS